MSKPSLLFHFSHAGLDVRLLDPPEHVPDPEVPGNYRRRNFPCRKPHAGPESSEEVRRLMIPGTNGSQRALNLREEALAPFRRQGPQASWWFLVLNLPIPIISRSSVGLQISTPGPLESGCVRGPREKHSCKI